MWPTVSISIYVLKVPETGLVKLNQVSQNSNLAARLEGSNLIGVDPGRIDLVSAVRSDDPGDNVRISQAIYRQSVLYKTFRKQELKLRARYDMQPIWDQLKSNGLRTADDWLSRIRAYYRNFDALRAYQYHIWFRRSRFQREVSTLKTMQQMFNCMVTPMSGLGNIREKNERKRIKKGETRRALALKRGAPVK